MGNGFLMLNTLWAHFLLCFPDITAYVCLCAVVCSFRFDFSKNGQPTIVARSNPNLNFGNAFRMSPNDIARVNRLYGCCELLRHTHKKEICYLFVRSKYWSELIFFPNQKFSKNLQLCIQTLQMPKHQHYTKGLDPLYLKMIKET